MKLMQDPLKTRPVDLILLVEELQTKVREQAEQLVEAHYLAQMLDREFLALRDKIHRLDTLVKRQAD